MRIIDPSPTPPAPASPTERTLQLVTYYEWRLDEDTKRFAVDAFQHMTEYVHRLANEPSIGLYHCSNHIAKAVPRIQDMQASLRATCREVDRAIYECTDATRAVCAMHELVAFRNTKDSISRSIAIVEAIQRGVPFKKKEDNAADPVAIAATPASPATPSRKAQQKQPDDDVITYKSF